MLVSAPPFGVNDTRQSLSSFVIIVVSGLLTWCESASVLSRNTTNTDSKVPTQGAQWLNLAGDPRRERTSTLLQSEYRYIGISAKIPEKPVTLCGALNDYTRKAWQPGTRIITAQAFKLPVSEYPIRSTSQFPVGTCHSRYPSSCMSPVRSMTSRAATLRLCGTGGVSRA